MGMSVCLPVGPWALLYVCVYKLQQIFCACYLGLWLGPLSTGVAIIRYVYRVYQKNLHNVCHAIICELFVLGL